MQNMYTAWGLVKVSVTAVPKRFFFFFFFFYLKGKFYF